MLADHTQLHTGWQLGVTIAVVFASVGFVYGQFRRGRSDAEARTLEAQAERIDILEARVTELEGEVRTLREENARLEGENRTLRSVLTGDTVSPAQIEAMRTATREAMSQLGDVLHTIEQGIARLLTKGDP